MVESFFLSLNDLNVNMSCYINSLCGFLYKRTSYVPIFPRNSGDYLSLPNIPNITPLISVSVEHTIPLLLRSIALKELGSCSYYER